MSKFCNVISESEDGLKSVLPDPLTYQHLEPLIDRLINETKELEADFSRKAAYVAERDIQTSCNNEGLMRLHEEIQKYAYSISILEEEIVAHEKTLSEISDVAYKLEDASNINLCVSTPKYPSDCAIVLGLVEALDSQMAQANEDMATINALIMAENMLPMSEKNEKVISSIMSLHLDLLLSMERSLERLNENCEAVDHELRLIKQKQTQLFEC